MYCPNCGKKIADGSKYCIHCGHKIIEVVEAEVVDKNEHKTSTSSNNTRKETLKEKFTVAQLENEIRSLQRGASNMATLASIFCILMSVSLIGIILSAIYIRTSVGIIFFVISHLTFWPSLAVMIAALIVRRVVFTRRIDKRLEILRIIRD